jgi:prevent-host-death family protein
MAAIPTVKAREQFAEVVNRAAYGKERIILTRRGKAVAAVVPVEDVELLERLVRAQEDREDVAAGRRARRERGGITLQELRKKTGL